MQPRRGLLNASSFIFVSFALLTVLYGRSGGPTDGTSKPNYFARGRFAVLSVGVIWVVATIAYLPSLADPFLFDDYTHLSNAARQSGSELIANALFVRPKAGDFFFRPVGYVSYWLDYRWAGHDSLRWHLWNVLVHATNSVLDYHSVDTYTIQHFCARMVYAIHNEAASADSYCG
jgi:hypothetical protein